MSWYDDFGHVSHRFQFHVCYRITNHSLCYRKFASGFSYYNTLAVNKNTHITNFAEASVHDHSLYCRHSCSHRSQTQTASPARRKQEPQSRKYWFWATQDGARLYHANRREHASTNSRDQKPGWNCQIHQVGQGEENCAHDRSRYIHKRWHTGLSIA